MNTYIHLFSSINSLGEYIEELNIDFSTDLLVQIYANRNDFAELKTIHRTITSKLPNSQIIGTVTSCNLVTSDLSSLKTSIIFTTFEKSTFRVFAYELNQDGFTLGKDIATHELTSHSKLAVLFSNIQPIDSEKILLSMKSISPDLVISGGIIPNYQNEQLFANDMFLKNGVVGYIIDSKELYVNTFSNYNFIPIGRSHIVTDAQEQLIKTIDNMTAKEFYEKYLGKVREDSIDEMGYMFPLLIQVDGKYYPKPILSITDEGYIITNTDINKGDSVSLGFGSVRHLINQNSHSIQSLKQVPSESILVYSSLHRHLFSKKYITYSANDTAPNFYGFYTHSEFVTNEKKSFISIGTMNIISISENRDNLLHEEADLYYNDYTHVDDQLTLLNLVENTSKELNILNQTLENMVMQKTNELLEHYYLDELTKLPNQNKLAEILLKDDIHSLALIDISSFVNINNFYGNYIGNKILSELAKLITLFCSEHHFTTYRIHADIFAITASAINNNDFDFHIEKLQSLIHKHCFMELSLEIYINTVIAISHHKYHIFENTSMTLEFAKSHKNSFLIYDQSLKIEESIKNNLIWTSKIRTAIEKDKIVPYYQPIYNNYKQSIDRFEVLMRLIDEDGTVVPPHQFLGIAKKANLYKSLTRIIIDKAFAYFKDSTYKFSINLSSEDIIDKEIRKFIYDKLENYPRTNQLTFEIVESEGIENYEEVKEFINVAKSFGVQIAIDDFGTGFSNFHYLFKLNVDVIKIDGSIIQQIKGEKAASLVAETIVEFAKKMGIATVAEFVSDEEIFNKTNELGINYSQGYYVAYPMESTDGHEMDIEGSDKN